MKILFTICGRAGSKGIKNKNLKDFLDFPLAFYTASVIDLFIKNNNQYDCDVTLNTDSDKLISLFEEKLKIKVEIIKRDRELAVDNAPKINVIHNSYLVIKERLQKKYDLIIDLDITSPLRTLKDLENIVEKKIHSNADVVFTVTESRRNPYFNMVKKVDSGYVRVISSNFNARQEAPEIFDMNASIYAYSPDFLMSGKAIFEGKCEITKMKDTGVLDIDNENDFELMEVVAKYLFYKYDDYKVIRDNIDKIINKENT